MQEKELHSSCAKCEKRVCYPVIKNNAEPDMREAPPFCPMKLKAQEIKKAASTYKEDAAVREFARLASLQEAECYEQTSQGLRTRNTRVEEIIQFAHKMNYSRLGVVFCIGLKNEARILDKMLEIHGFEVVSVCCKAGAVAKESLGIKPEQKIHGPENYESMCNPIAQAEIINSEKVDLAILLGLCVGHDSLFIKYCQVPITVLAAKDRVLGHNPLAALYLSSGYYSRLMHKPER